MTPEQLAALHALCFPDGPRPWTAGEFKNLMRERSVFVIPAEAGFAMGRLAGSEAELLTICTHPAMRRKGIGHLLMTEFEKVVHRRGAGDIFLEVAAGNGPAIRLYLRLGYGEIARRPRYYTLACGERIDAIVMKKTVAEDPEG